MLRGVIEQRVNNSGADETRLIQQLSTSHGYLCTRLRIEQRFIENAHRMGLRVSPRIGVAVPIDAHERWTFKTYAKLFLTLHITGNA